MTPPPDRNAVHAAWLAMERAQGHVVVRHLGPTDATFKIGDEPYGRWRWHLDPDGTVVRRMDRKHQPFGGQLVPGALTKYRRVTHRVLRGDHVGPPPSTPWRAAPPLTRAAPPPGEPNANDR